MAIEAFLNKLSEIVFPSKQGGVSDPPYMKAKNLRFDSRPFEPAVINGKECQTRNVTEYELAAFKVKPFWDNSSNNWQVALISKKRLDVSFNDVASDGGIETIEEKQKVQALLIKVTKEQAEWVIKSWEVGQLMKDVLNTDEFKPHHAAHINYDELRV